MGDLVSFELAPCLKRLVPSIPYISNFYHDNMADEIYDKLAHLKSPAEKKMLTLEDFRLYKTTIEEYPEYIRNEWKDHHCLFSIAFVETLDVGASFYDRNYLSQYKYNMCLDLTRFFKHYNEMKQKTPRPSRKRANIFWSCCEKLFSADVNCDKQSETLEKKFLSEEEKFQPVENISKGRAIVERLKRNRLEIPKVRCLRVCDTCKAAREEKKRQGKKIQWL